MVLEHLQGRQTNDAKLQFSQIVTRTKEMENLSIYNESDVIKSKRASKPLTEKFLLSPSENRRSIKKQANKYAKILSEDLLILYFMVR